MSFFENQRGEIPAFDRRIIAAAGQDPHGYYLRGHMDPTGMPEELMRAIIELEAGAPSEEEPQSSSETLKGFEY
jgi:hypothetical protein